MVEYVLNACHEQQKKNVRIVYISASVVYPFFQPWRLLGSDCYNVRDVWKMSAVERTEKKNVIEFAVLQFGLNVGGLNSWP